MYTVKCDGNLLMNKLIPEFNLGEAVLSLTANTAGSLIFVIYDSHPFYESINMLVSRIKVYKNGSLIWLGRPRLKVDEGRRAKRYQIEGCLSFLKDSYVAPYDFSGSPEAFFQYVITQHNNSVADDQKFVIGNCTVTDPNDYIVRSSISYDNAYNVLQEKLVNHFGGYLYITFNQDDRPVLSYLQDVPNTSSQLIEFGKNLVSFSQEMLYDEFYTACIPLGAKIEGTDERLTIKSVNDSVDFLVNTTLAEQYGLRYAPTNLTTWDDVTVAANLKTKGQDWLSNVGVKYKDTIMLSAIDISVIEQNVGPLNYLWKVGFKPKGGSAIYYVVSQQEIDLNSAANLTVTLGETKSVYTGLISNAVSNVSSRVDVIEADYTTKQDSQIIAETVIETTTEIQTQAAAIIAQVLESYYTKGQVDDMFVEQLTELSSSITQLSNSVTTSFEYYQAIIDGNTSSINNILSWVKIVPETPNQSVGIIIGNSESAVKFKVENDILYIYTGDDTAPNMLMWLDAETLHIDNVEIQQLSIGVTGKLLTFRIVGTGNNTSAAFIGRMS